MTRSWLIRRSNMSISRPMPREELIRRIEAGEVSGSDEVCESAGYWFYLNEIQEVRSHFGDIELGKIFPRGARDDTQETDSTDTRRLSTTHLIETGNARDIPVWEIPEVEQAAPPVDRRLRNLIGVGLILIGFFAFLVWIWMGSY